MSHNCKIEGRSNICFEFNDQLWIKEYDYGTQREVRTYKVNFCPECGFKIPKVSVAKRFFCDIPNSAPDESITLFSQSLSTAIAQMNHNVELIKDFMSSQNTQNECFMQRDLDHSQEICKIERQILNLEKIILDNEKYIEKIALHLNLFNDKKSTQ